MIRSVSPWQATAGRHTLLAVVDDVNRYPEISEDNNTREIQFQIEARPGQRLSDVIVKDIAFERNVVGQTVLAALVENVGGVTTPDVVGVAFLVDDQYATYGAIPPLEPGQEQPVRAVQPLALSGTPQRDGYCR